MLRSVREREGRGRGRGTCTWSSYAGCASSILERESTSVGGGRSTKRGKDTGEFRQPVGQHQAAFGFREQICRSAAILKIFIVSRLSFNEFKILSDLYFAGVTIGIALHLQSILGKTNLSCE